MRDATEAALGSVRPATVRARFHECEGAGPVEVARLVDGLGAAGRSSHGLVLKAPDHHEVAASVRRAAARGIPTVTLVTDVAESGRVAYVGLDNGAAGATAAYLLSHLLGERRGPVVASVSHRTFLGEQERIAAFSAQLALSDPHREVVTIGDVHGEDAATHRVMAQALARRPDLAGIYSVGGGNTGLARALAASGRTGVPFIGHDLDADNLPLLRSGVLTAVLHHDLRSDLRAGLSQLLRAHGLLPGAPTSLPSAPQVITPFNIPARLRGESPHG